MESMNFALKGEAPDSQTRINFQILDLQSAVLSSVPLRTSSKKIKPGSWSIHSVRPTLSILVSLAIWNQVGQTWQMPDLGSGQVVSAPPPRPPPRLTFLVSQTILALATLTKRERKNEITNSKDIFSLNADISEAL